MTDFYTTAPKQGLYVEWNKYVVPLVNINVKPYQHIPSFSDSLFFGSGCPMYKGKGNLGICNAKQYSQNCTTEFLYNTPVCLQNGTDQACKEK